jgi:hypothetical protein
MEKVRFHTVYTFLSNKGIIKSEGTIIHPKICPRVILKAVHPFWYLLSLNYSLVITKMIEVPVCFLPNFLLRLRVLEPMLCATYGSICKV